MKTKVAVLRKINKPLSIEEIEIPALKVGQVLVKILYSGLCRSQINEIRGRKGKEYIPHLLGHEAAGVVVDIGKGVKKVAPDDFVVASWIKGDGINAPNAQYKSGGRVINAGAVATFCEYAVISENRVMKINRKIEARVVALFGCAVPTGMGIVEELGISENDRVVILGVGGIGASALMRAVSVGAYSTAVDTVSWKLRWAKDELGVNETVRAGKFNSKDFDFAIECSGARQAMETAFNCIHDRGIAMIAGNLEPGERIAIDPFNLIKGRKIIGTWGGGVYLERDLPRYIKSYLNHQLPVEKLITAEYQFEDINKGLIDLESGKLIRGVVKIAE